MKDGNWVIRLDDRSYSVRATHSIWTNKLSVYLDDALIHSKFIWFAFGELYHFERGGHQYVIRIKGWGKFTTLELYVDGREADHVSDRSPGKPNSITRTEFAEDWRIHRIELVETERVQKTLGEDMREIDNSKSNSQVQRRITLSREWSQSVTVEHEKANSIRRGVDFKLPYVSSLKLEAERAIRDKYSTSTEARRVYSEEVVITIPAKTRTEVVFIWKQVWQCGLIRIHTHSGLAVECPYRLCLEPTFDQRQVDRPT